MSWGVGGNKVDQCNTQILLIQLKTSSHEIHFGHCFWELLSSCSNSDMVCFKSIATCWVDGGLPELQGLLDEQFFAQLVCYLD
jgi:hypothetical protein